MVKNLNVRDKRGSVTIFVLIIMLYIVIMLLSIYSNVHNKISFQNESVEKIKKEYIVSDGEIEEIYNKLVINKKPELIASLKEEVLRLESGDLDYKNIILSNVNVINDEGTNIDAVITYTLSENFDINTVGYYTVEYTVSAEKYKTVILNTQLIVSKPPSIDFIEAFNYSSLRTQLNSQKNSVINITSTDLDPQIEIPFSELEYVPVSKYRYVVIRYRCKSSQSNLMGIFATPKPTDNKYFVYTDITTDGSWKEAVLDLWSNEAIKNIGWITGIRFDYTNNANVEMDIDYIKFVENLDIEYAFYEGFDTDSYTNYIYNNLQINSCSNSILNLKSTSIDPTIQMQLKQNQYFDPKVYKFIYIKYKINTSSDRMEMFMIPNPSDQTYSVSQDISGVSVWNTAIFEITENESVWNLEQINGWRFDPVSNSEVTIEIDFIGVSDRCR